MKIALSVWLVVCLCNLAVYSQTIYVDGNTGDDHNPGTQEAPLRSIHKAAEMIKSKDNDVLTMRINPGIYVLEHHVSVSTEKELADKHIVIEASVLPDDPSWTPEKMPVIVSRSGRGEIMAEDLWIKDKWIVSFFIDESHATIRGLKFLGYGYPVSLYYPIARFNKSTEDLLVEQCMFVADQQVAVIQVGVIAHGSGIKVDHCIFYGANNAVVYWQDCGNGSNTGNGLTHCIVCGASGTAVFTDVPNEDFLFADNVVADCRCVWTKGVSDTTKYAVNNSVLLNNQHGLVDKSGCPKDADLIENNVVKDGNVALRRIKMVFQPLPVDHLHAIPGSLGFELGAGLFKSARSQKGQSSGLQTNPQ